MRKMFYNKKILQNAIFVVQNAKQEKTDSKFLIFTKKMIILSEQSFFLHFPMYQ